MLRARSQRASRAAHPPPPSTLVEAAERARAIADSLEADGRTLYPNPVLRASHVERGTATPTKRSKRSHAESHLLSIHARDISSLAGEPAWSSFFSSLPLSPHGVLLTAALRSSSVRVSSVTEKAAALVSANMGSSQQSSRICTQGVTAAWAAQAAACLVSLGIANAGRSDPRATGAASPIALVKGHTAPTFVVPSNATSLGNALTVRLAESNLLETMTRVAEKELKNRLISSRIRQPPKSCLRDLCARVVNNTRGDLVWLCFALLNYLAAEARGRELLRGFPITDLDVAVADAFLRYGCAEVTRRARLSEAQLLAEAEELHIRGGEDLDAEPGTLVGEMLRIANEEQSEAGTEETIILDDAGESSEDEDLSELRGGRGFGNRQPPLAASSKLAKVSTAARTASRLELALGVNTAVLAAKRKRHSGTCNGAYNVLAYWWAAVHSQHAYVLLVLISSSKKAAMEAAETTVVRQVEGGSSVNPLVHELSRSSVVKSSAALKVLLKTTDVPQAVAWRAPHLGGVHVGMARSEDDLQRVALLACNEAPLEVHVAENHTRMAWVSATQLPCREGQLPGVLETVHRLGMKESEGASRVRAASIKERIANMMNTKPAGLAYTGVARGVLTFSVKLVVAEDQQKRGREMAETLASLQDKHRGNGRAAHPMEVAAVLQRAPLGSAEPLATPGSNLGLALLASECLRPLYRLRPRSGNPARVFLGLQTYPGEQSDASVDLYNKPNAVLQLVDVAFEPEDGEPPRLTSRPDALHLAGALSFTVAGDSPVRLPEAAVLLDNFMQARALVLAAASTASFVEEQNNQMAAGSLNAAVASAKRVLVADNQKFLRLTPWQVYRVGHRSVRSSFESTAWAGAYPVGLELGSGGGLGRNCSAETADRRNHGKLLMGQEVADEFCTALAENMFLIVSDRHYDKVPVAARGIPHHALPGLHQFLDHVADGLDSVREKLCIAAPTVDSLQALPFGPFAESLAPNCSKDDATEGTRFRNRYDRLDSDSRSFLVDATVEDAAIFREPLCRRLEVLDVHDNPFAHPHEQFSSLLNALATVALLTRVLWPDRPPREQVALLYQELQALHRVDAEQTAQSRLLALDAMVLFHASVYPQDLRVGEPTVPEQYVEAHAAAARRAAVNPWEPASEPQMLDSPLWRAMSRPVRPAWPPLADLMAKLLELDGRYDLSLQTLDEVKELVDGVLRGSWNAASPDGVAPPPHGHPVSEARSPEDVTSAHLMPIFVDRFDEHSDSWVEQRGSPVGVKLGGFRQLIALMLGSHMQGVSVQLVRNEGGLLLRASAAPDILTATGKPRSEKAVSPISVEGDNAAFGTRAGKMRGCARQRKAWDANLRLLMPLCIKISPPRGDAVKRHRGELSTTRFVRSRLDAYRAAGIVCAEDAAAEGAFVDAARN